MGCRSLLLFFYWVCTTTNTVLYTKRIGAGAPIYLVDVLEYLAAEILELASNAAHDKKKQLPSAVGYQKR